MKYLGIDYGLRKIGLAISDGQLASVYDVLNISSLNDALSRIKNIIDKEDISQVVIGIPESGAAKKNAERFAQKLSLLISVIRTDETLSSQNAKNLMINLGVGKKERENEDSYSAALILQNFLDSLN